MNIDNNGCEPTCKQVVLSVLAETLLQLLLDGPAPANDNAPASDTGDSK